MARRTALLHCAILSLLSLTTQAVKIYGGDGTYYSPSVGLGSCGKQNQDTDFVAALATGSMTFYNPSNPNNNPICGHKVQVIQYGDPSKTVTVTIVDTCPGCKGEFDLDLSPAAFNALADPAVGRIKIAWEFVDGFEPQTGPLADGGSSKHGPGGTPKHGAPKHGGEGTPKHGGEGAPKHGGEGTPKHGEKGSSKVSVSNPEFAADQKVISDSSAVDSPEEL